MFSPLDFCFKKMSEKEPKIVCQSGPWLAVVSRSRAGQIYYFNCKTGEKTWDKPPTFDTSLLEPSANTSNREPLTKSGNKLKIKSSPSKRLRDSNSSAPYSNCPRENKSHKTCVKTQRKERKNLGSFAHTFHPPAKPLIDTKQEEPSAAEVVSTTSFSSASSQVSLIIRDKKSPRVTQAPDNIFSEEEIENKSDVPSITPHSTPNHSRCLEPPARTWLKDVPFGILNSSAVVDNQTISKLRSDMPLYLAKQGREKQTKDPAESNPSKQHCVQSSTGIRRRSRDGEVSVARQPAHQASASRRGLGEERMRKLRDQLTQELLREEDKKQTSVRLSQDDPTKATKKRGLLPTPPSSTRIDRDSNSKKDTAPKKTSARRGIFSTPLGVEKLRNSADFRKNIENVQAGKARKRAFPTPSESIKIDNNSNIKTGFFPDISQRQGNLTSSIVHYSSDFKPKVPASNVAPYSSDFKPKVPASNAAPYPSDLKAEVPASNAVPAAQVFESEAMEVDEEAQVVSEIKALRTATTWESFDTKCTPMETEIVGVSSDATSTVIIVLDTNILLSHLCFVRDLRDILKLNGEHPVLYLPWMVLQELDRLKDRASSKRASSARAAVSFLNDSLKRKHPRVRGQTGREASRSRSSHVDELCPDDSILESCLQLQEQGLHTWLLSNDVSLCTKALVHNIKAVTKIQLTNEMRNSAETNSLLYQDKSPSPEKKFSAMDRLSSARQPALSHPITSQAVQSQPVQSQSVQTQIETEQTSVLQSFKNILLDTFTKVLSTGMEAVYGSPWTKRVLYKPPWELHNVFICVAKHWFALCDSTTPETVQKAANELRKIFQKSVNYDSLDGIIELTKEIISRLPFKYDKIIAPLEEKIQAISSGRVNYSPGQNCPATESQFNANALQPNVPPVDSIVLAYFGSLWNILHPFCTNIKQKLDNGTHLDSDTRNHCKEMLSGTEELVKNITGVLSVPESDLDGRHPGLQGIFDILRSATPPEGAEPLQLEHVYNFCLQPKERLLLFNGLSQLDDCGRVLRSALK